jgi:hypothetical protein
MLNNSSAWMGPVSIGYDPLAASVREQDFAVPPVGADT